MDKLDQKWWTNFVRRSHYFEGASVLGELKRKDYLDFINKTPIKKALVLKTDLFVEAKDQKDNYLPSLVDGNHFVGMDISLETVREARAKLNQCIPDMQYIVCDVTCLPFKKDAFDCVISDSTLDHIPLIQLPSALSGLTRVLKDKGKLILSLNSIYNLPAVIMRTIRNKWNPNWFFTFSVSLGKVLSLLRKDGYQINHYEYILPLHPFEIFLLRYSHRKNIAKTQSRKWAFFFQKITKKTRLSKFFCIQFIVSAEKRVN